MIRPESQNAGADVPVNDSLPEGVRALLNPRSVVIIGASDDPTKLAGNPMRTITESKFKGSVYPVNPGRESIAGRRAYASVDDIEGEIDVALVVAPRAAVIEAIEACGRKGVKAAVVISGGFADAGENGEEMQRRFAVVAKAAGVRIVGPNCTGCYSAAANLPLGSSASLVTGRYRSGSIALITQSGAIGTALVTLITERELGLSLWFSTGNEMDLTVSDFLAAGVEDAATRSFCLYLEAIRDVPKFRRAARRALEAGKPIIAHKVGSSEVGAEKAQAHTGALVGSDAAYSGFFRQLGVIRVSSIDDLLPIASLFHSTREWGRGRIGVITHSGGLGAYMADRMSLEKVPFAKLSEHTMRRLADSSEFVTAGNPFDPGGMVISNPQIFINALHAFLEDPEVDVLVVAHSFAVHSVRIAVPLLAEAAKKTGKMICVVRWMPADHAVDTFAVFRDIGVPVFRSVDECVTALAARTRYQRDRVLILSGQGVETSRPALPAPELEGPHTALLEPEAQAIFARYGIPGAPARTVTSVDDAVGAARSLGYPVVLKAVAHGLLHKTEAGGVLLDVREEAQLRAGYAALQSNVAKASPGTRLEGVLVQAMAPNGIEVILGAKHEPGFGPLVVVGMGGVLAEAIAKVSTRPVPLTANDAEQMIDEAGLAPILASSRHGRPYDRPALVNAILNLSRLLVDHGSRIGELDINPLRVLPAGDGVVALDALLSTPSA